LTEIIVKGRLFLRAWSSGASRQVSAICAEFCALRLNLLRLRLKLRDCHMMPCTVLARILQGMQHPYPRTVMTSKRAGIDGTCRKNCQDGSCREKHGSCRETAALSNEGRHEHRFPGWRKTERPQALPSDAERRTQQPHLDCAWKFACSGEAIMTT
jgi:hypothetical protein